MEDAVLDEGRRPDALSFLSEGTQGDYDVFEGREESDGDDQPGEAVKTPGSDSIPIKGARERKKGARGLN